MESEESREKKGKILAILIGIFLLILLIKDSVYDPIVEKIKHDDIIMRSTEAALLDWETVMNYDGYGGELIAIRGEPLYSDQSHVDVILVNGCPWAVDSSDDDYEFNLGDWYANHGDFISYGELVGIKKVSFYLDYVPLSDDNELITVPMPYVKSIHVRSQY